MVKRKLNKKEYILKAAKLCGIEKVEIEALKNHLDGKLKNPFIERRNEDIFRLYELYEKQEYRPITIDENGNIDLDKSDYITSRKRTDKNKFGKFLVITPNLDLYIAMDNVPYDIPEKFEKIAELNNLLLPQISKKMGVSAAEFRRAIHIENSTEIKTNHLTKNFLNNDEILIPGNRIIKENNKEKKPRNRTRIKLESILESTDKYIKKYYEKKDISEEEINSLRENIRRGLIKQTIINKFFFIDDEPLNSWGLIKNKNGDLKLAPLSRFSYCVGVKRESPNLKHVVNSKGKEDIQSFMLDYGKEEWFKEWIEKEVLTVNFEECIEEMQQKSKVSLKDIEKEYYRYFFDNMKEDVQMVVDANYDKDKLPKRRKRLLDMSNRLTDGFQNDANETGLQKIRKMANRIKNKIKNDFKSDSEMSQEEDVER